MLQLLWLSLYEVVQGAFHRQYDGISEIPGSMLGILYTFWGMGFLIFRYKGSFFLPRVMWVKIPDQVCSPWTAPIGF